MCMGVNRPSGVRRVKVWRCPHVHGGEPPMDRYFIAGQLVVPMCMGVNRTLRRWWRG